MHSVWLAAKIASGQASRRIERMPATRSRLSSCHAVIAYSTTKTPASTSVGCSARRTRHPGRAASLAIAVTVSTASARSTVTVNLPTRCE